MQFITSGRAQHAVNYDLGRVAKIDQREWNATGERVLVARSPFERLVSGTCFKSSCVQLALFLCTNDK